jgi:hypothetical protein
MPIEKMGWITPEVCRASPNSLFVFGDNLIRKGKGGQAIIRDEPNAVGIVTKRLPTMAPAAFLTDDDFDEVYRTNQPAWFSLGEALNEGRRVIFPRDGIGTGRARLSTSAPTIYAAIQSHIRMLEKYR